MTTSWDRQRGVEDARLEQLVGKTLVTINGAHSGSEQIDFLTEDGEKYRMLHHQDCCERVSVEDVCGDIVDLIGSPIVFAEEASSDKAPDDLPEKNADSSTWTFYRLATRLGRVTIRWYGSSNGYYGERASFERILPKEVIPDCDICSECKEHASYYENADGEVVSNCCEAGPTSVDTEYDLER